MTEEPIVPTVPFRSCPIQTSLGVLGRKWTMLILRDIAFLRLYRFNQILRATPGLTPRVLSLRLRELEAGGFIRHTELRTNPRLVTWSLTEKGTDTLPLLMGFIDFGSKWYSEQVFADKAPRTAKELFPDFYASR
ncbi:MAG: helix-turn-helix transcriptional regulator [Nitrososphaerota archaeon]|nr:helix-turn-helix transcriptional regulator [Nitrososphaerota archaeon]